MAEMFAYAFFRNAFVAGTVVAVTAGVVGYFVILRGLSFAAHALSHVGFAGAAGAVVLRLPAVDGLLAFTNVGAVAIGFLGDRIRGRDATIGIVLAWTLGLGALFMSLYRGNATEAYAILFGEIFGIGSASLAVTVAAAGVALLALAILYRPLLYASIDEDGAFVDGVPVRSVGVAFMLVLGIAVAAAAQVVGVLLIFTLLVTPAAIADRLTARPPAAMLVAVAFALAFTWAGLVVAFYMPYPASFFITSFAFGTYLFVRCVPQRGGTAAASGTEVPMNTNLAAPQDQEADGRVPVTVLTGFLGSGKTTLLNRILTENHGKRIAVIENEFGEIGIDQGLVVGADEEIFEMNNGCICCTVRGDLIRIIGDLMRRRDRFDYILVETTGMADPGPVAQTFFMDDEIKGSTRLDGIVTMVDAKHIWQHIDESNEAKAQVAFADVILLNKTDLVDAADLNRLEQKIRAINGAAKVYRCRDAAVAMERVLDVGGFDLARALDVNASFLEPEYPFEWIGAYRLSPGEYRLALQPGPDPTICVAVVPIASPDFGSFEDAAESAVRLFSAADRKGLESGAALSPGLAHDIVVDQPMEPRLRVAEAGIYAVVTQHLPDEFGFELRLDGSAMMPERARAYRAGHTHDQTVTSVGLRSDQPLDPDRLNAWLSELVRTRGTDIFRMKGIVAIAGDDHRWVFQGVHMLVRAERDRPWGAEQRRSELVFIGRELDRGVLESGFGKALA